MTEITDDELAAMAARVAQVFPYTVCHTEDIERLIAEVRRLRSLLSDSQEGHRKALVPTLAQVMSDISEECWCAGWYSGLEYRLWQFLEKGECDIFGQGDITEENLASLRELSNLVGGWVIWDDESEDSWRKFVPLEEWLQMYRAWEANLPAPPITEPEEPPASR